MRPPAVLRISIRSRDKRGFGLWLPLFLLWPLAAVLVVVAAPVWYTVAFFYWAFGKGKRWLIMPWRAAALVCSLPGLRVDVENSPDDKVKIHFS